MRSAAQISRTPREHHDAQRHKRERTLRELLAELRRARASGAEWYRWIAEGRPPLTVEQYAETQRGQKPRGRRGTSAASSGTARP